MCAVSREKADSSPREKDRRRRRDEQTAPNLDQDKRKEEMCAVSREKAVFTKGDRANTTRRRDKS